MNENVMAIISQSVSTTVMNLLLFLFYRRIYEPKFQNKTVYIFTFIATTALFITINGGCYQIHSDFIWRS